MRLFKLYSIYKHFSYKLSRSDFWSYFTTQFQYKLSNISQHVIMSDIIITKTGFRAAQNVYDSNDRQKKVWKKNHHDFPHRKIFHKFFSYYKNLFTLQQPFDTKPPASKNQAALLHSLYISLDFYTHKIFF